MDKIQEAQELADKLITKSGIKQVGDDKGALKDEPESVEKSEKDREKAVAMKNVKEAAPVTGRALAKMRLGIERNDKNYKEGNDMDPKAKANAKKRVEEADQTAIAQQKDTLFDRLERVVKPKVDKDTHLEPAPTSEGIKKFFADRMPGKRASEGGKKMWSGFDKALSDANKQHKKDMQKAKAIHKTAKYPTRGNRKSPVDLEPTRRAVANKTKKLKENIASWLRAKAGMSTNADKLKNPKQTNSKNLNKYGASFSTATNKQFKKMKEEKSKKLKQ